MKKILLSAVALMSMISANAQTTPYVLSAVGDNTYAVTQTQEELAANYGEDAVKAAWSLGVGLPKGTVLFENDDLTITGVSDVTFVLTANYYISQIKEENPGYTGYINMGSSLGSNNWPEDQMIQDISDAVASNQSTVLVVPKKAGKLSFGAYGGDNSREIGIYKLATDAEKENDDFGKMVAMNNFRNDGNDGTVAKAPAFVEADAEAGREYLLLAGGKKNVNMHQIKFVPGDGPVDGIATVNTKAENNIEAIYTLSGAQVSSLQNGVNIVKLSNGKSVKVIK